MHRHGGMSFETTAVLGSLPLLVIALVSRRVGRVMYGIVYLVTALFNVLVSARDPAALFSWGAQCAVFPFYAEWLRAWAVPHALLFTLLVGVLMEACAGLLILSRDPFAKYGLALALLFNALIAPLHLGVLLGNAVLAAGEVWLMSGAYPENALSSWSNWRLAHRPR